MDLDSLLRRQRLSLMTANRSMTLSDKRAHQQFACDYAEQIGIVRDVPGGSATLSGSLT